MIRRLTVVVALGVGGCAHPVQLGELVVHVRPDDARVSLDDHVVGSGKMLSARALRLRAGTRRIEVEADGYYGARREAVVHAGARTELTVELHAIPEGMKD